VLGLEPEQAIGLPLEALLVGVDAAEAERRTSQGLYMRSSQTWLARFELNARRHDGTEFPAEVSLSRIDTADGARYACVVRDVTEQRMTFSMLNLYSRALECTTNGVVIIDMKLPGSRSSTPTRPSTASPATTPARHRPQLRLPAARRHGPAGARTAARGHPPPGARPRWCCATTARTARCSSTNWRSRRSPRPTAACRTTWASSTT
jgi:PAS domain S-box-containing protein